MLKKIIPIGLALLWFAGQSMKFGGNQYKAIVNEIKAQYPFLSYIPTNLVMAMMEVESNFHPNAVGSAGEQGLMQVKPQNFDWLWYKYFAVSAPDHFDPKVNILTGMLLLHTYQQKLNSWTASVMSYNVGYGDYVNNGVRNWTYVQKVFQKWLI